jgi:hypothetical protein
VLQADLSKRVDPDAVARRLAATADRYPHLGSPPAVCSVPAVGALRHRFASEPYGAEEPLVRAAVGVDEPGLLLAAHHGAVDGIGLLALLGAALAQGVYTNAPGVGDRPAAASFLAGAARRLAEAVFAPPTKLWHPPGSSDAGDALAEAHLPYTRIGTAALTAAACSVAAWWNGVHGVAADRMVVAVGAARHGGANPVPAHQAVLLRLRLPAGADLDLVRGRLRSQPPEPDFAPIRGPVAAVPRRLLARRLGATFLVSNLGHVEAPVRALAFYPVDGGPAGIAFGCVSSAATTTLTVRTRRRDLGPAEAEALLRRLVATLAPTSPG